MYTWNFSTKIFSNKIRNARRRQQHPRKILIRLYEIYTKQNIQLQKLAPRHTYDSHYDPIRFPPIFIAISLRQFEMHARTESALSTLHYPSVCRGLWPRRTKTERRRGQRVLGATFALRFVFKVRYSLPISGPPYVIPPELLCRRPEYKIVRGDT